MGRQMEARVLFCFMSSITYIWELLKPLSFKSAISLIKYGEIRRAALIKCQD